MVKNVVAFLAVKSTEICDGGRHSVRSVQFHLLLQLCKQQEVKHLTFAAPLSFTENLHAECVN
jgi:hypothetical protein